MPADPPELDAPALLSILDQHQVNYIVVGGYAAQLHGSTRVTTDIDVTPDRSPANLARLAAALRELGGGIRVDDLDHGLPFDTSPEALSGIRTLNLRTPHGDIDLTFEPDGTNGYPDLIRHAQDHTIGSLHVHVAALADIIRSKTAAGRAPKTSKPCPNSSRSNKPPPQAQPTTSDSSRGATQSTKPRTEGKQVASYRPRLTQVAIP